MKEDFKEHNLIFTQWKRQNHFTVLKSIKVTTPDEQTDPSQSKPKESKMHVYNPALN
jgi:hypothetical protein